MWILPPSITSAFAQDTGESISASPEQWAEACAQSLIARSKPSPPRTWLQRWKRDSWTRHLSGLISSPSHGKSFVDWWTSSVAATRASHFQPLESEPERTTRDTFGLGSQMELPFADLNSASSRTSKDTFRWDSPQSLATWKKWVTERRGAYSQRLKLAHLTNGSGSSSWPTAQACEAKSDTSQDRKARGKQVMLSHAVRMYGQADPANHSMDGSHPELWATKDGAWTTPAATDTGRTTQYQQGGKALSMQAAWPTPTASECRDQGTNWESLAKKDKGGRILRRIATLSLGPADSANPSTDGSRRESWLTPRANEPQGDSNFVARNADRGEHCHGSLTSQTKAWITPQSQDSKHSGTNPSPNGERDLLANQASGKLNPRWVETLMGVPIGWTMPSCTSPVTIAPTNSDCSETESCQPQQSELF
jgi:hypothetical protein